MDAPPLHQEALLRENQHQAVHPVVTEIPQCNEIQSKPQPPPSPMGMYPPPPMWNTGYLGDSGSLPKVGLWVDPNPQINPDGNITEAPSQSRKPGTQLFVTDVYALMAPMEVPPDDLENSAWWNGNFA